MQIDMMQTARLVPYIRSARTHSPDQAAQIAASIAEFGFTNPILISEDDVIIAGHGRLMAAQSLGLAEVPVIVLDHLSEAQRRALILADNRIAENAGWDNATLASELAALRDENFDLEMIGFDEAELEELLAGFEFGDAGALGGGGTGDEVGGSDHQPAAASSGSLAARFGIPPYWNLEVYSGDPADLSALGKDAFFEAYARIIAGDVSRLRDDRFAVGVIGDVRDAGGSFVNLPGKTVEAFEAAGARLYNDAILVTAVGSLPIRAGRQCEASRKLGRTHQNVLVFCKGDPKRATESIGQVEFGEIDEADGTGDEAPQE